MAAASLFSLFIGWVISCVGYIFVTEELGIVQLERDVLVIMTALSGVVTWGLACATILRLEEAKKAVKNKIASPFIWCLAATVGHFVASMVNIYTALAFPISSIMGLVAGIVYPRLKYGGKWTIFYSLFPPTSILLFLFVLWPILEWNAPHLIYDYASYNSKLRMQFNVIKQTSVGETFDDLHRRLPQEFADPFIAKSGEGPSGFYEIYLEDGIITKGTIREE